MLGLNREVLASTLFELWELPEEIINAVRFQYTPNYEGEHQLYTHLIALTHAMLGENEQVAPNQGILEWAEALGLQPDAVTEIYQTILQSHEDLWGLAQRMAS